MLGNFLTPVFNYFSTPIAGYDSRTTNLNTNVHYDYIKGILSRVQSPILNGGTASPVYTYQRDQNGKVTSFSDGAVTTTYTYTSNSELLREQKSSGNFVQYTYNGVNITKVEDNLGVVYELLYTDSSHPNAVTGYKDAEGRVWNIERNSFGQVLSESNPGTTPTVYTYAEDPGSTIYGWLKSITKGGETISYNYTPLGKPSSISTFATPNTPDTTLYSYDAGSRITKIKHPDSKEQNFAYTGRDLSSFVDEAGILTMYTFCPACGKLTSMVEALGRSYLFTISSELLTKFTDALGNITNYTYGVAQELKEIQYPDSSKLGYKYDNFGRLKQLIESRTNYSVNYNYDTSGRVSGISSNTNSSNYRYNADDTLSKIEGANQVIIDYTYTPDRLVSTVKYNFSLIGLSPLQTLEYTYNTDRTISTLTWKNGASIVSTWSYTYTPSGRLASVTTNTGESVSYNYDGEGKIKTVTRSNGTSTEYSYNEDRNWITTINHKSSDTPFETYTATNDGTVGHITGINELNSTVSYTYVGDKLLGEITGSSVSAVYTWGAGELEITRLPSKSLFHHYGFQGETRFLTNASGNVADSYNYSAYGKLLSSTAVITIHTNKVESTDIMMEGGSY